MHRTTVHTPPLSGSQVGGVVLHTSPVTSQGIGPAAAKETTCTRASRSVGAHIEGERLVVMFRKPSLSGSSKMSSRTTTASRWARRSTVRDSPWSARPSTSTSPAAPSFWPAWALRSSLEYSHWHPPDPVATT
jgi:hypothetical protein